MPTATSEKIHGLLTDFHSAMLVTSGDASPFQL
jgi:hypothetical protein